MRVVIVLVFLFYSVVSVSASVVMESGEQRAHLLELFTSQGCSSCPPAERWLNRLQRDETLWTSVVPLAFHVDYWDALGWKDPYASAAHGKRQRRYFQLGRSSAVYTPGFFLNGHEWRGYRAARPFPQPDKAPIKLRTVVDGKKVHVEVFAGDGGERQAKLELNVAVLGFGIATDVGRGENAHRQLKQEFVVLDHYQTMANGPRWAMVLPPYQRDEVQRYGIAVWASDPDSRNVLQALGGWL